jgi:hypothetical protein
MFLFEVSRFLGATQDIEVSKNQDLEFEIASFQGLEVQEF